MEDKIKLELTQEELKSLYYQVEKDKDLYNDEDIINVYEKLKTLMYVNGLMGVVVGK